MRGYGASVEPRISPVSLSVDHLGRARQCYEQLGWRGQGVQETHDVRSRAEVDEVLREAVAAGATVTRPAAETFYGGYAGVFTDADGHAWEIAHDPGSVLHDDGTLTVAELSGS